MNDADPFDLRRFDTRIWITGKDPCWDVAQALDDTRHFKLVSPAQIKALRLRDKTEARAGQITQYKAPTRKKAQIY